MNKSNIIICRMPENVDCCASLRFNNNEANPTRQFPTGIYKITRDSKLPFTFGANALQWCDERVFLALNDSVYLSDITRGVHLTHATKMEFGNVSSAASSEDGNKIAIANSGGGVRIYDVRHRTTLNYLYTTERTITAITWTERKLVLGLANGAGMVLDLRAKDSGISLCKHNLKVKSIAEDSTGIKIATGSSDHYTFVNDLRMLSNRPVSKIKQSGPVNALSWRPFHSNVLTTGTGHGDTSMRFWNTAFPHTPFMYAISSEGPIHSLQWSADGFEVYSTHGAPLFNVAVHKMKNKITRFFRSEKKYADFRGHSTDVINCTLSTGNNQLLSMSRDGIVCVWGISN